MALTSLTHRNAVKTSWMTVLPWYWLAPMFFYKTVFRPLWSTNSSSQQKSSESKHDEQIAIAQYDFAARLWTKAYSNQSKISQDWATWRTEVIDGWKIENSGKQPNWSIRPYAEFITSVRNKSKGSKNLKNVLHWLDNTRDFMATSKPRIGAYSIV